MENASLIIAEMLPQVNGVDLLAIRIFCNGMD
jgi:hypothetical protein